MIPIQIDDLDKRYGETNALRSVDLTVEENEVFALVGPNGAGKSTLVDILLNYTGASDGCVRLIGKDPRSDVVEVHRQVGVLPQGFDVFPGLTAEQHVEYALDAKDATGDPVSLLNRVGLGNVASQSASKFSRGMEQRLALAMALTGRPDVLVLDEPFSGIDPNGRRLVRSIVHEEIERGATVLLASHELEHVRTLSTRIGIMVDGELKATGTEAELRMEAPLSRVIVAGTDVSSEQQTELVALESVSGVDRWDGDVVVRVTDDTVMSAVRDIVGQRTLQTREPTLDDVFAYYTLDGGPETHRSSGRKSVDESTV